MIPYEELVAALDRWRARNGLPVASTDLPPAPELPRQPLPVAAYAAPAIAPVVSAAAAVQPRQATDDEIALDDEVVEEDEYNASGDDFAMSFGAGASSGSMTDGAAPPRGAVGSPVVSGGGWEGGAVAGEVGGGAPAAEPLYDEGGYDAAAYGEPGEAGGYDPDGQTYVPQDAAAYAGYAEPVQAAEPMYGEAAPPAGEPEGDEDEDWAKLYPQLGNQGGEIDADADGLIDEEHTIGGDFDPNER